MKNEEASTALREAAEASITEIVAPEHSPQERTAKAVRSALASTVVHPSKVEKALALLREFTLAAVAALDRPDYDELSRVTMKFRRNFAYSGLSEPVVERPQRELWSPTFQAWGWDAQDIDAAFVHVKIGDKVESVSWDHFIVTGRRISREAVRLGLKPRWSNLTDHEWLAKFPPMQAGTVERGGIVLEPVRDRR